MRSILFVVFVIYAILGCKRMTSEKEIKGKKVTTLPFFNSQDFTPEWIDKESNSYQEIHKIPDFSFVNQNGDTITQEDYLGKIYVADFFFTTCSGICRSLSLNMKMIQDAFIDDPEILLLSHSVTPQMDSVAVLKKYAKNYGVISEKWNLVTGEKEAIYELARSAYFSDEDFVKTKQASEFIHTENFLLVDTKGRIRGVYNGTLKLSTKRLMRHIEILKTEE